MTEATEGFALRDERGGMGPVCRRILATLPEWFGIADAVEGYVAAAEHAPSVVASSHGDDLGILTWIRHGDHAAEVSLLAVRRDARRRGLGRAMLSHLERELVAEGVEYLQVKTLSSSHRDEGYEETRAFYRACGFRLLEEMPGLWGPENPAVMLVKRLDPRQHP